MARPLLINQSILADFESGVVLKDIFKMSREWLSETAGSFNFFVSNGGTVATDANGWQNLSAGQRAGTLMCRELLVSGIDAGALYTPGSYVLTYTGEGRIILGFDAVPQEKESNNLWAKPQSPGRILFTVPSATGSGIYLGIDEQNAGNPIRNIVITRTEFEGTIAANPWDPAFLVDMAPFSHQRVMNWQQINYHKYANWSDRATLNTARYTTRRGMPLELMIDLANRTGDDLWVCVPHKYTDAAVQSMGDLINAQLNPQIGVWVEYTNEVWNTLFDFNPGFADWDASDGQGAYCQTQGLAAGLDANAYQARLKFYSRRSRQVLGIFRGRFTNPSRVKRVIAGHHEGDDGNNNVVLDFESASANAEVFATAPYWGDNSGGAANAQNTIDSMQADLNGIVSQKIADHKARASARSLQYAFYEGGTSPIPTNAGQIVVVKEALYDVQVRTQYEQFFNTALAVGVDLVGVYSYCTRYGTNGAFGHLRRVGELPRPPRWVALENFANQTVSQPTNPGSQALVTGYFGFDFAESKFKAFAGPQAKATFSGSVIDFVGPLYRTQVLTSDTTFTAANALRGSQVILELQGNFQVRWPSSFRVVKGRYDGSNNRLNRVSIYCQEATGTPVYEVEIETLPAAQTGLLLRQALVTANQATLFSSWAEVLNSPSGDPATATRYSRLGEIERFRRRDGFLYLRVRYPLSNGGDGQPQTISWRQRTSPLEPLSRERVLGYQLISSNLINAAPYGGLCRTSVNEAYLSYAPGQIAAFVPFLCLSRHGLAPFLDLGNSLILTPNQVLTTAVELYAD